MKYVRKYSIICKILIKKPLRRRYGNEKTKEIIVKADQIYREMLNRCEDIGEKNPMVKNIYMGFYLISIYRAGNGVISLDEMRNIIKEIFELKYLKLIRLFLNIDKERHMNRFKKILKKSLIWAEKNPEYKDKTWDFNFIEDRFPIGVCYHFTYCPLHQYCKEHDLLDILKVVCETDYLTARLYNGVLFREKTLATGGDRCDYWFVGSSKEKECEKLFDEYKTRKDKYKTRKIEKE